ncbi:MAG: hypothetical protein HYU51_13625 [Candidatus Rokubacteria bacterium]|nr:hypothetical protein [Candidatus Rokubacteria bacterium]
MAGFAAIFAAVMLGEYLAFRRGLVLIADLGLAGAALTLYFVESILVLILLVSLVSYLASGLWIFYRAKDTPFLRATPLSLGALYTLRSSETFAVTSWALVVVGVPALLALGVTHDTPPEFYAGAVVILALFAALIAGAGALLTTIAAAVLSRTPTRLGIGIAVAAVVLGFVALVGKNVVPSTADFYAIFQPGMANGKPASIKFIEAKFTLWPSHPFAAALYAGATGRAAGSTASRAALVVVPLVSLLLAFTAGRRLYARTLPVVMERFTMAPPGRAPLAPGRPFPRRLRGPIGAMLERDVVTLARNPHELGRMGFIAFLLALYTAFVLLAPLREVGDRPHALARLMLFNVSAAGYFLTAFGLRFVFPSTSLEGRAAWVFFSSPISRARLVMAKLALFATLVTVAVVPIALAGTVRLVRDPVLIAAVAVLLLLLAVTTASVLLAFGTAWPDFREANPEVLSTSASGLAATVVCLVYVALVGWIARAVVLAHAAGDGVTPWLVGGAVVSAALVAGSLALIASRAPLLEAR